MDFGFGLGFGLILGWLGFGVGFDFGLDLPSILGLDFALSLAFPRFFNYSRLSELSRRSWELLGLPRTCYCTRDGLATFCNFSSGNLPRRPCITS